MMATRAVVMRGVSGCVARSLPSTTARLPLRVQGSVAVLACKTNLSITSPTFNGLRPLSMSSDGHHIKPIDADAMAKVVRTWHLVEKDLDHLGSKFFVTLFDLDPKLKDLFSFRAEATDGSAGPAMRKHAVNVLKMIGDSASGQHDLTRMKKDLTSLGDRHKKYGVMIEHFPTMQKALLLSLEAELGPHFSPDVKAAWEQAFHNVSFYLIHGLVDKAQ